MLGFEDSGTLPLVVVFDDLLSSACTHAIMSDALKRKQMWMKKLEDLKVEGLLALRDVVLATSIEHMAGVDDCKMNLDQIKTSVRHCCNVSSMSHCVLLRLLHSFQDKINTDFTLPAMMNYLLN